VRLVGQRAAPAIRERVRHGSRRVAISGGLFSPSITRVGVSIDAISSVGSVRSPMIVAS
jgi:hypothetical protein